MPISGADPALTDARLGVLRLGAGRLGFPSASIDVTALVMTLGGVAPRTRIAGIMIRDVLNDAPNTCSFTVDTTPPAIGEDVKIGLGDLTGPRLLFGGTVESFDQVYEGQAANLAWRVTCGDYTTSLNRRKVRKRYGQQSASFIVRDLLANYTTGFTTTGVVGDLPSVIGGIEFTEEDVAAALTRIMARIGGYWYPDYVKNIHGFLTEVTAAPDDLVAGSRTLLDEPPLTWRIDRSQLRTRVLVEGNGSTARRAAAPGDTALAVIDASFYSRDGGIVVSGPQRITYTGIGVVGGPDAPAGTAILGAGNLAYGPYVYKTAFVDAGGEGTLSEASAPIPLPGVDDPSGTCTVVDGAPSPTPPSGWSMTNLGASVAAHRYAMTWVSAAGEGLPSPLQDLDAGESTSVAFTGFPWYPTPPAPITGVNIYRTNAVEGYGGPLRLMSHHNVSAYTGPNPTFNTQSDATVLGNAVAPVVDTLGIAGLADGQYAWRVAFGTAAGHSGANTGQQCVITLGAGKLSALPVSADPRVISRIIYRTVRYSPDGSDIVPEYQYEATIPDNTTLVYVSTMPDASLGDFYLGDDTSGGGQIDVSAIDIGPGGTTARRLYRARLVDGFPGAPFKLVETLADNTTTTFTDNVADGSLGGVASPLIDEQLIGIPGSGDGSIVAPIAVGDPVNILAQCDDLDAQDELAALEGGDSDGVVEHYIADRRLSIEGATAVGNADLALFARPIVTISYASLDAKTRSGKTVHVDLLAELGLPVDDYTIQSVTISQIGFARGVNPRYTVEASSVRFSFEDVLRRLRI